MGLLGFCEAHYLHPLTIQKPRHQWMFLAYHDLVGDLETTVWQMLHRLQYDSFLFGANDGFMKDLTLQDMLNVGEFQSFWFHNIVVEHLKTSRTLIDFIIYLTPIMFSSTHFRGL